MDEKRTLISQDIIRSFRKNLGEEAVFMCFYMGENVVGIVTNERLFTGQEVVSLLSSVINANEDFMVPAIMYSLFNVYGPIKVFDIVKDYSRGFEMEGPFKADIDSGSGDVPAGSDN